MNCIPFIDTLRKEFSFIRGNYAILVMSWILVDFAVELPATYYSLYVLELGATETILGVIGLSQFFALASMQFPGGYLADKYGRKWLISTMTFGVGLSFVIYAIAQSWLFILVGAILLGFFNSTYQPALNAMISDSLPPERRGMGFSIVSLISAASTTPGPAVAGLLRANLGLIQGMRVAYGITVALFMVAGIFRLFFLRETVVNATKPRIREIIQSYPTALKESFGVWRRVSKSMLYLFFSFSIAIFGFSATNLYTVIYATRVLLIDEVLWGFIIAIVPLTTIIMAIPVGKLVDKIRRKVPILVSLCLFGLSIWIFLYADLIQVVVSLIILGVGNVMLNASFGALQTDLTPQEERGKVSGFINFAMYIVLAAGSLTGGYLYEHITPQAPFILAIITFLSSLLFTLVLVKEPERREE